VAILDHRIKDILHHFRDSGRLNVLVALIAHANVRNRCWPSMRLIAKETGYGLAAVNEAKKWLEEHGAIEIVKYDQRAGDEKKTVNHLQNIYQLTGVIKFSGKVFPYLYVSVSETLTSETSPSKTEVVKEVKVVKEKKEITTLPAAIASGGGDDLSHTHTIANEADDMSMFPLQGKRISAQEGKVSSPASSPSPSLKPTSSASEDTTPSSPSSAAPLLPSVNADATPGSAVARVNTGKTETPKTPVVKPAAKRSEKQLANDARIEALRMAMAIGRGKEPIALEGKEISNYSKIANELVEGGIAVEDFLAYVEYWNKAAQSWPGGLTLNSLVKPGRITDFKTWFKTRKKADTRISDPTQVYPSVSPLKRGYDKRLDPAYAPLYETLDERKQAK
jgi:hypothetical protein